MTHDANLTDPTELGAPRPPRKDPLPGVEQRIKALPKTTTEETVALAARILRSRNPLRAASTVSVRDILAMAEVIVSADAELQDLLDAGNRENGS